MFPLDTNGRQWGIINAAFVVINEIGAFRMKAAGFIMAIAGGRGEGINEALAGRHAYLPGVLVIVPQMTSLCRRRKIDSQ